MMALKRKLLLLLVAVVTQYAVCAQPFADEIQHFKKKDSLHYPETGPILFVGSSSFRIWTSLQEDFPGYPIINRGFGGSTYPDLVRYINEIIFPYHPKQVVIYCGDNDLASSPSITADSVVNRFIQYFNLIRAKLPDADILFVSIKPSPSRAALMPSVEKANTMIRDFLGNITIQLLQMYTMRCWAQMESPSMISSRRINCT